MTPVYAILRGPPGEVGPQGTTPRGADTITIDHRETAGAAHFTARRGHGGGETLGGD